MVFLQLGLEPLKQGKGISRGPCEAGQHLIFIQTPYLAGVTLHHGIAHGYLSVAANDHFAMAPDR